MSCSKWWLVIGLVGCAQQGPVAANERVETAEVLANARGPSDFLLDLARWYRSIYTPPVDFDADGRADLAAGTFGLEERVNVWLGGTSGFAPAPDVVIPSP